MESLIPTTKLMNKRNSLDKMDEKRKKLNDEDARKKREEALRLQTEEKRRQGRINQNTMFYLILN